MSTRELNDIRRAFIAFLRNKEPPLDESQITEHASKATTFLRNVEGVSQDALDRAYINRVMIQLRGPQWDTLSQLEKLDWFAVHSPAGALDNVRYYQRFIRMLPFWQEFRGL